MRTFRKYEFGSKSAATTKINALPTGHDHAITRLGNIITTPAVYDTDGSVITAPVYSSSYHVDVLWDGDPVADWDNQMVWCAPVGVHVFGSSNAIAEWTEECKVQRPDLFPEPSDDD